ncbi:MAG: hypothetical protein JRN20_09635 [Nitrososphaerota archaeon]|nr:hypothetical protein [Nitrososphaerota archaeon]
MQQLKTFTHGRFAFELDFEAFPKLVPATCSTTCQCKQYFPCRNPKHNPCTFKIPFEANHTHILIEETRNGITDLKRVCVSPKCFGTFDGVIVVTGEAPVQTPPVRCYICYYQSQQRRDMKLLKDDSQSSVVWSWRVLSR